ncbi:MULTISPECIES: DUF6443 domain-containing protein [Sphingobacterium]|uniref:DUF6443 domain-containing protein n=1 Tax=Sphingobacterium TaxID=28453 RepID=UPI00257E22C4|nr:MULTISPECIES: DUF6443 domain-containing protein [Sphingobacterium]
MKKKILTLFPLFALYIAQGQVLPKDTVLNAYSNQTSIRALNSIILKDGFYIPSGKNVTIGISTFPNIVSSPTAGQNYILTKTFRAGGVTPQSVNATRSIADENQTVQYIDGLGRPSQTIELMASPTYKDVVQHVEYDGFGREAVQYLPHVKNIAGNGSFNTTAKTDQLAYYAKSNTWDADITKTEFPYAVTIFENSPLNRVQQKGFPGSAWQPPADRSLITLTTPNGRTLATEFGTNGTNDVKLWTIDASGSGAKATFYAAGQLNRMTVKDENWVKADGRAGTIDEYKDFGGRVVLKRQWNINPQTKVVYPLETYFIYDDLGNLKYVLPPAVSAIAFTETASDPNFDRYIYAYKHDGRKRVIKKKIPGKGWEYIVYNKNDQVIFTRDAEQLKRNEWSFTKYDAFGRIVMTGIETGHVGDNQEALQKALKEFTGPMWEERGDALESYTNNTIPQNTANMTVLEVNYYDSYDNISGLPFTDHAAYSKKLKTLLTASKTRILGTTKWLWNVNHYDDYARVVDLRSTNHLDGTDVVTNTYSFPGELLTSTRTHSPKNGSATKIITTNDYDHVGRLVATKEQINVQAEVTLASNRYNEIGQLKTRYMGKSATESRYVDTTNYSYHERGWTKRIASTNFTQSFMYEDGGNRQYNGNISALSWRFAPGATTSTFNYTYDRTGRLLSGISTPAGATSMSEVVDYDDMGNIKTLKRDALPVTTYAYSGNKLVGLTGGLSGSYTYDDNGNAKTDRTGMAFTYNYLNLPQTAIKAGTNVTFLYDATGKKLQKLAKIGTASIVTTTRDYLDGIEYNNGTIEIIYNPIGYALKSGTNFIYHYNLTDNLGNVRTTLKRGTSATAVDVVQRDNYYPFGKRKVVVGGYNKYLYNGKEIQGELGETYDYGARFYDAEVGRWFVVDPAAEIYQSYSPYNYVLNSPIGKLDPNGMWEKNDYGGWSTNDPEDIAEFMLQNEGKDQGDDPPKKKNQENKKGNEKKEDKKKKAENDSLKENKGHEKAMSTAFTIALGTSTLDGPFPFGEIVGGVIIGGTAAYVYSSDIIDKWDASTTASFAVDAFLATSFNNVFTGQYENLFSAEHTKGARPSTLGKHQKGQSRRAVDRGGEKGETLPPRKRPPNWKGPWPPKK